MTPRCISGSVPPRAKNFKGYTHVFGGKVPMLTLFGDSFTPKFKMAPENRIEVVLFWHVWLYLKDI